MAFGRSSVNWQFWRLSCGREGAAPAAISPTGPFILVVKDEMLRLPNPRLGGELLAMASTFAGNLTLLGSVANVIVAERGRPAFFALPAVRVPLALSATAIGTAWLAFVHRAG